MHGIKNCCHVWKCENTYSKFQGRIDYLIDEQHVEAVFWQWFEFPTCRKEEQSQQHTHSISPFQRALFSMGEDMHVCGHGRCEILYVDVTERLTSIVCGAITFSLLLLCKVFRGARRDYILSQEHAWNLPAIKYKST